MVHGGWGGEDPKAIMKMHTEYKLIRIREFKTLPTLQIRPHVSQLFGN